MMKNPALSSLFSRLACPMLALVCLASMVRAQVTFVSSRTSFEEATSELVLLSDGFERIRPETFFRPTPTTLFGGNVTISETETLSVVPLREFNKIVALPEWFGQGGIDSPSLAGNYLLGRVENKSPVGGGEQFLTFTIGFEERAHAVGFDLSGAAAGNNSAIPDAPHFGIEVRTKSNLVETMQILIDDGFFGVVGSPDDPITSLRLLDVSDNNVDRLLGESFGLDNLVVGVVDPGLIIEPALPFSTFRIEDPEPTTELGNSVAAIGDVNGDGIADFAVSGSQSLFGNIRGGIVRVFSGADGSVLHTIESQFAGEGYAESRNLIGLGDLDGDGFGEIAVGSPPGTDLDPAGFFEIFRGNDGTLLRSHSGVGIDQLGYEIAALGDVDGDGVPDYAASNFELGNEGGRVRVYSGAGGQEIAQVTSSEMVRFYSIAGAGDLNGDGRGELAVTLWSEFEPWNVGNIGVLSGSLFGDPGDPSGAIDVLSDTARQATLLTLEGRTDLPGGFESIGLGLNALGDINGDGIPDLGAGTGPTSDAVAFSGADGARLREVFSDQFDLIWQTVVETEGIGDLDGDGVRDFVVGLAGSIRVISGEDGSVLAERLSDGKLGEEIAAIGDLDGDGISEILAGAPEGGFAELISFSLERTSLPATPSGFTVRRQGDRTVVSWRPGLDDATLEKSSNLVDWETVTDVMFDTLYVVPALLLMCSTTGCGLHLEMCRNFQIPCIPFFDLV